MKFRDWIGKKYLEWRGDKIGRESGVTFYARWLGVSPSLMSQWMNDGAVPQTTKIINKLVEKYGGEVYSVLELDAPIETSDLDSMTDEELDAYIRRRYGANAKIVYKYESGDQNGRP
jgi:hypothetical protein